jgi:hypothetical protein
MKQIEIHNRVEYYPFTFNKYYNGNIYSDGRIIWYINLFSNIQDEYSQLEIKEIEELILKQYNIVKENDTKEKS